MTNTQLTNDMEEIKKTPPTPNTKEPSKIQWPHKKLLSRVTHRKTQRPPNNERLIPAQAINQKRKETPGHQTHASSDTH